MKEQFIFSQSRKNIVGEAVQAMVILPEAPGGEYPEIIMPPNGESLIADR